MIKIIVKTKKSGLIHFVKESSLKKNVPSSLQYLFRHPCGWGNGYVAIPPGHPCHGMEYDDIHHNYAIEVHGGLTFSTMCTRESKWFPELIPEGWWVVGFDTNHFDSVGFNSKESVEEETIRLKQQLESLREI